MRVKQDQVELIVETLKDFVDDASIYLFGSRTDDSKRGGDIDIFLKTDHSVQLTDKISMLIQLEKKGIERKVDLIVSTPDNRYEKLYREVIEKGIPLC